MMKNVFYFILEAPFVLNILNFSPDFFGYGGKRFDMKINVNFKLYGVINWIANNYNTHIAEYLKKEKQSHNEIW